MGCNWSQKTQVLAPNAAHQKGGHAAAREPSEEIRAISEDEPSREKKKILRRWSQSSLDSAASLLSLDRVAAGHGGTSILKYVDKEATEVPDRPKYVMKVWDEVEASAYRELGASDDALLPFTPAFFGEVDRDDLAPELKNRYMRLSNVLEGFGASPNVMDCKLGIRSFTEEEVSNTKLREDLYQRLEKLDASLPTDEERQARACTKYRWMSVNDSRTTLQRLGFRIDGIESSKGKTGKDELRKLQSLPELAQLITEDFLPKHSRADDSDSTSDTQPPPEDAPVPGTAERAGDKDEVVLARTAAETVLKSLRAMREAMEASEFVRSRTFVGCSLLFVAEAHGSSAGVYLIDFAHTTPVPDGITVDHRSPWKAGNHEDGLLLGMDNVIQCWEAVLAGLPELSEPVAAGEPSTISKVLASI